LLKFSIRAHRTALQQTDSQLAVYYYLLPHN
jgi:hypothetical protein